MYPSLAKSPRDNSSYLQAFRHLYVLAAKEQGVDVIDVRSNRYIKETLDSSDDIIGLQYINSTLHTFENPTVSSMLQGELIYLARNGLFHLDTIVLYGVCRFFYEGFRGEFRYSGNA